jgi:hypothetical protein
VLLRRHLVLLSFVHFGTDSTASLPTFGVWANFHSVLTKERLNQGRAVWGCLEAWTKNGIGLH